MTAQFDIAIVGAGMAGASLAYFLGSRARVVMIEAEAQPGYHTTGRSAAFYAEIYGGPAIQPLTTASKSFFNAPPAGFGDAPLLSPRGGLHIARAGHESALDILQDEFAGTGVRLERLGRAEALARAPELRSDWCAAALWEPDCTDIDVAALHQGFLSGARRAGTSLMLDTRVTGLERVADGWRIESSVGAITASIVVNAAGAWGDILAAMAGARPLGLAPLRRTVVVLATEPAATADLPLVIDAEGNFYFKPDAGRLWVSPHDETPAEAADVRPEEIDIAIAIDRLQQATTFRVKKLERAWAGLRTFAPDRAPVYGFDPEISGFFWCVGQGGFGIQTAPAAGQLAASLVLGQGVTAGLVTHGVSAGRYAPRRFR